MDPLPIFKALADESRLRIVHVLGQGVFNVQEITTILDLSQSTVSHHLKTLQQAGVIRNSREGTWAFYALSAEKQETSRITEEFLSLMQETGSEPPQAYVRDLRKARELLEKRRDTARDYFDRVAKEWKDLRSEALGGHVAFQEFLARIPQDGSLLELGCGSGSLLEHVLPRSGTTIAVDYSLAMLEEAKQNLGKRGAAVDFRLGYLEHLPLADDSVDVAVAYMVFHHLPSPKQAFADVWRVLKPGGRVLIADLVEHSNETMRERFSDLWLGFNLREFETWLTQAGFSGIMRERAGDSQEVFFVSAVK